MAKVLNPTQSARLTAVITNLPDVIVALSRGGDRDAFKEKWGIDAVDALYNLAKSLVVVTEAVTGLVVYIRR